MRSVPDDVRWKHRLPGPHGERRLVIAEPGSRTLHEVGMLRHAAYGSVDALPLHAKSPFLDDFDVQARCTTFALQDHGQTVASIRAIAYCEAFGWEEVAAHCAYADEITACIGEQTAFVESSRFVVSPAVSCLDLAILFGLFRAVAITALALEARFIVTAVRPSHSPLYLKWLGFEQVSKAKTYPGLTVPMVLLLRQANEPLLADLAQRHETAVSHDDIEMFRQCRRIALQ